MRLRLDPRQRIEIGVPGGSAGRVVRGGSWNNNNPENLRASARDRNEPDNRNNNNGFRCVRSSQWYVRAGDIHGDYGRRGRTQERITPSGVPAWDPRPAGSGEGPKTTCLPGLW
jgi:hypothetical protein